MLNQMLIEALSFFLDNLGKIIGGTATLACVIALIMAIIYLCDPGINPILEG